MGGLLIGYARCSTQGQDLRAQIHQLEHAGVASDRIYLKACTGIRRDRGVAENDRQKISMGVKREELADAIAATEDTV